MDPVFIEVLYTNYRGETRIRKIQPMGVRFGSNEWHKEDQYLLTALDAESNKVREFALKDCNFRAL